MNRSWGTVSGFLLVTLTITALAFPVVTPESPATRPNQAPATARLLSDAVAFLWKKQHADGGWHSEHYGLLKSGQAYTPFILYALLNVPDSVYPTPGQRVDRALAFIRRQVNDEGAVGLADPDVLEYPNYSTAYALLCLVKVGRAEDAELIRKMTAYLAAEQFDSDRGISESSPAFGCWGFGGHLAPGETGHVDLAHTRRVLQALQRANTEDPELLRSAQQFLRYLQRHPTETRRQPILAGGTDTPRRYDGGFYFSPVILGANKGRMDDSSGVPRSYATATCDGILALLAAGVQVDDERVQSARRWLTSRDQWEYPSGIPVDHPEPWGKAVTYYHLAARAEAYAALGIDGNWRTELSRILASKRQADGSYSNPYHLMKEDDPLLATSLAVVALTQ